MGMNLFVIHAVFHIFSDLTCSCSLHAGRVCRSIQGNQRHAAITIKVPASSAPQTFYELIKLPNLLLKQIIFGKTFQTKMLLHGNQQIDMKLNLLFETSRLFLCLN